jgi:hypothetical protein
MTRPIRTAGIAGAVMFLLVNRPSLRPPKSRRIKLTYA